MKIKVSSIVLWCLVAVMLATAVGLSCADSGTPACDLDSCVAQCRGAGHLNGECRASACFCNDTTPADADADVVPDVPSEDGVTPVDDGAVDEATPPDVPVEDVSPTDDAVRDDAVRDDGDIRRDDVITSTDEGGGGGEDGGGEAKSGCDPLLCFMSCGGTCSVGGDCVCPPR